MTLTFETVVDAMSDLRYKGHEPAYLLVETGAELVTDGGRPIPDPEELTVGELEESLGTIEDADVLRAVMDAEMMGDDRTTAKDAIEERIVEVTADADDEEEFVVDDPADTADDDESADDDEPEDEEPATGGSDSGSAVEDDVRMIEPLTVLETTGLPDDVRAVLFGENFDGRILIN